MPRKGKAKKDVNKSSKRKRSVRKTTPVLKKRFRSKIMERTPMAKRLGTRKANLQPRRKQNLSIKPMDITPTEGSQMVLKIAKKDYLPPTTKNLVKGKLDRASKWKKVTNEVKKRGKQTLELIEETGKFLDKAGAYAEKVAPTITYAAATNPEIPGLPFVAGIVDTAAAEHRSYHKFIDDSAKAMIAGDPNRQATKSLTDSWKYQKLMQQQREVPLLFGPSDIDLPPVSDDENSL